MPAFKSFTQSNQALRNYERDAQLSFTQDNQSLRIGRAVAVVAVCSLQLLLLQWCVPFDVYFLKIFIGIQFDHTFQTSFLTGTTRFSFGGRCSTRPFGL
jgi:hypothetical protein